MFKMSKYAGYQTDLGTNMPTLFQCKQSGDQDQEARLFVSVVFFRQFSASVSPEPSFINQTSK